MTNITTTFTASPKTHTKKVKRRISFAIDDDAAADQQQQQQEERQQQQQQEHQERDESSSSSTSTKTTRQPLVLTDETCAALWYQPEEIACLKHATRQIVLYGQNFFGETDTSGLERYSVQRSHHKKEVLRYILMIHRMGKDADCLGGASRKSTAWASVVANQQGYRDYCDVYDPLHEFLIDGEEMDLKELAESEGVDDDNSKRKMAEAAPCCERRVRQRTSPSSLGGDTPQMLQTTTT
eukprot:CAMPEP_0117026668 /NCGR_PEP_ID=MMETSP0472-20121206/19586_1 /TAXON_ID=693140 ORGANISM="Tiarina fusus, Strain LIS" /NCGR_SAMPLE_ID=MMETSP0472 /ASSEMBLY_ACC=CAM_ASM_000603 /LENGTH=238 /DNA_ID=CAMNT_0004733743 /DNA_START=176 /DNA_END=892 /DNA_ORIENTATION=+